MALISSHSCFTPAAVSVGFTTEIYSYVRHTCYVIMNDALLSECMYIT